MLHRPGKLADEGMEACITYTGSGPLRNLNEGRFLGADIGDHVL